jgi:hypothetical protein
VEVANYHETDLTEKSLLVGDEEYPEKGVESTLNWQVVAVEAEK